MKLKTNLHFHTDDDPQDSLNYSFKEGVDRASKLGYDVLALTCHNKFINNEEYSQYAKSRGILFIGGIEATLERAHVVILNPTPEIEEISTLRELREYKKENPQIFVMAPHPFHLIHSLGGKLEKNIDIFDALEHSWFYSATVNPNVRTETTAQKQGIPLISTSDTHKLSQLHDNFAVLHAREKSVEGVFEAVRAGNFENKTSPSNLLKMASFLVEMGIQDIKAAEIWRNVPNPARRGLDPET